MRVKAWYDSRKLVRDHLLAGDGAPLSLGIDSEGLAGIFVPDLLDVGLVVVCEEALVEDDTVVGAQSADGLARGIAYDQRRPAGVVGGALGRKARANGSETVCAHACDMLSSS